MRYTKQKSTGRLIEMQSGGNPSDPKHLQTLKDNAVASGFDEADIEVGYEDDAVVEGWRKEQDEAAKTYADKRREEYNQMGNQFEMIFDDQDAWRNKINEIKAKYPKE